MKFQQMMTFRVCFDGYEFNNNKQWNSDDMSLLWHDENGEICDSRTLEDQQS